ncbi:hypothetical protein Hbal_0661 [Hirschia baltica ATCC 49814]|uniref:Uncharacterized protein n=1 Tax=Hirschia baltica (strain ATCC 49814 / DSM 5838 / IFAM 1418) TaxID=582402 RepID=C6XNV9_HIRBI|nr:hypothetical protein Hbal_0661 [Hirschia baltica ATCC 49814]
MFKRSTTSYGPSPFPETPYQKAGQIWEFVVDLRQAKQFIRGMNCRHRTLRQQRIGSFPLNQTNAGRSHAI